MKWVALLLMAVLAWEGCHSAPTAESSTAASEETSSASPSTTTTTTVRTTSTTPASKRPSTPQPPPAPVHVHSEDCKDSKPDEGGVPDKNGDYYDQRQNGTHNIRVEIDNVVILHAPLDMGSIDSSEGDEEISAFLTQLALLAETDAATKTTTTTSTSSTAAAAAVAAAAEEHKDKEKVPSIRTQKRNRVKQRLASILGTYLQHH